MSDTLNTLNETTEQSLPCAEPCAEETAQPTEASEAAEESKAGVKSKLKNLPKKKKIMLGAAAAAVLIIAAIIIIPSKFDRVKNECVQIAGIVSSGKGYFTLDTYPDSYENMDETMKILLLPDKQEDVLEAIRYANSALGFPGYVYDDMINTTALMGRQEVEAGKYTVSWTYHPDDGLKVTYSK